MCVFVYCVQGMTEEQLQLMLHPFLNNKKTVITVSNVVSQLLEMG